MFPDDWASFWKFYNLQSEKWVNLGGKIVGRCKCSVQFKQKTLVQLLSRRYKLDTKESIPNSQTNNCLTLLGLSFTNMMIWWLNCFWWNWMYKDGEREILKSGRETLVNILERASGKWPSFCIIHIQVLLPFFFFLKLTFE